ncbi:MAG: putative MAPEG superfamily protein [Cryomorphaceae bacterium]|jgi:uncharacterized MAPEG superfamily protein
MTTMIIGALALTLFQLWILPASLNILNVGYLISSRDGVAPDQSVLQGRISRAGANLQENLPAFLVLGVLAIIQQVDLTQVAMIWIGLRALYLLCYMFNLIYLRTLVWLGSLACMIYMALELL